VQERYDQALRQTGSLCGLDGLHQGIVQILYRSDNIRRQRQGMVQAGHVAHAARHRQTAATALKAPIVSQLGCLVVIRYLCNLK
jgi:hypothetical protein